MRMLRKAGVALALLAAGCGDDGTAAAPAHPLAVEPAFLDFGSLTIGDRREASWTIRNVSTRRVRFARVGPSGCQCARLELVLPAPDGAPRDVTDGPLLDLELAPGAAAEVRFVLDTARYREPISRKVGGVGVFLHNAPYLVLEWGADIWNPFAVEPWNLDLGEIGVRQRAGGRLLVSAHDAEDFELDANFDDDGWELRSRRLSPPEARALYEIRVTAPPELPEGGFQREFRLLTSLAGAPPVRFWVSGVARPDLSISPTRLMLDPARGRGEARLTVWNRAAGGMVAELRVEGLAPGLLLSASDPEPAARRGFTVSWSGPPPTAAVQGRLLVHTGDAERPVLEVPYSVLPERPSGP